MKNVIMLVLLLAAPRAYAQGPLSLRQARSDAARNSPALVAARAAVEAAGGRERQAGAYANPLFSYSHEQLGGGSGSTESQATFDQRIEFGGQRASRMHAARLRREAAEARLEAGRLDLDFIVAQRFAMLVSAQRRAVVTARAAAEFKRAQQRTGARLASGDVSGYDARRITLEAARYAALAAQAQIERNRARLQIAELVGAPADSVVVPEFLALAAFADTAAGTAISRNPLVRAANLEARAAEADIRAVTANPLLSPTVQAGYKTEKLTDRAGGFVLGLSLPLPLWDRRQGLTASAGAEARRLTAEAGLLARRVTREAVDAAHTVQLLDSQLALLAIPLGTEALAALRGAETAYLEGEISLLEWLDAVRAYQEAEVAYANILAEAIVQRAALERLLGIQLMGQ